MIFLACFRFTMAPSICLLSNEHEVVHHVLWQSLELLPQNRILRCDSDRACVEVALAHHDTTHSNERCRGKAEALGSQQCSDDHITTSAELSISLQSHATTKAVQHQGLVSLGQADFPRSACVLDACPLGCTSATITSTDQDVVCLHVATETFQEMCEPSEIRVYLQSA